MKQQADFDVVICGGGLAGLGLARQLSLSQPDLRILLLEKQKRPLPAACHKVGESTVEGAAHWFCRTLKLDGYINRVHLRKFGLRFFTGGSVEPFEDRIELGGSSFSALPSYQLDRGILENDLRGSVEKSGVQLLEGSVVSGIRLGCGQPHQVAYRREREKESRTVSGRWVVDALGRRRMLQTSLQLGEASKHKASACWWRTAGEVDIDAFASSDRHRWRTRVQERRWFSTNHLMGDGYWVWLIPLASDATSLGIVAEEKQHPIRERKDYAGALQWLRRHEPTLARAVEKTSPLDFLALKHFSHSAQQVFSHDRWCTIGEAAVFTDPLYSHGSDLVAWACGATAHLIRLDSAGSLDEDTAALHNEIFLETVATMTELFQDMYGVFADEEVMLHKLLWDCAYYWAFVAPMAFRKLYERPEALARCLEPARRFRLLNRRFQDLCRRWSAARPRRRRDPGRYGFRSCDWVNRIRLRLLQEESDDRFLAGLDSALGRFEEMLQVTQERAAPFSVCSARCDEPSESLKSQTADLRRQQRGCDPNGPRSPQQDLDRMRAQLEKYLVPAFDSD